MNFELISDYQPTGDQPEAITQLTEGIRQHVPAQTLLGVTGSGKTFTIANVIKNINKPTLILSHNKTLAAQLYGEFKNFFPHNAVEYYVSYYDYYQPEAYIPSTDTYIEKDLAINEEIDKLRLAATSSLLSGRKDVIVVSSVSCIYGMGNPADFYNNVIEIKKGKLLDRNVNGKVIMYADRITDSMRQTIDETNRRREKQLAYNEAHGITPKQITRSRANALLDIEKQSSQENSSKPKEPRAYTETEAQLHAAADPVVQYMSKGQLQKSIEQTRKLMQEAAKKLDFIEAAQYRDELLKLEELLKEKS